MATTTIIGIKMTNRIQNSTCLQDVLTKHGCYIKTRIGLHSIQEGVCSPDGIVLLEIIGSTDAPNIEKELLEIDGIEIQKMVFDIG